MKESQPVIWLLIKNSSTLFILRLNHVIWSYFIKDPPFLGGGGGAFNLDFGYKLPLTRLVF